MKLKAKAAMKMKARFTMYFIVLFYDSAQVDEDDDLEVPPDSASDEGRCL